MLRINDRKAPRLGKAEFSTVIVNEKLYQDWKEFNPEYNLTYKEFLNIWDSIVDNIRKEVSINPMGIKLPFSTGEIRVQFLPKIIKATDNELSSIENEKINFSNIITRGKVAKVSWIRKNAIKFNPNIILFAFEQSRIINQELAKVLWDKPEIFRITHTEAYKKNTDANK